MLLVRVSLFIVGVLTNRIHFGYYQSAVPGYKGWIDSGSRCVAWLRDDGTLQFRW